MKISLNTIKQLVNFDLPPVDELVARINAQLGGVEEVINLGAKYKDARIVRVISAEKHPDADKLSVCKVDDGGATQNVERDENGCVQVVCGAPNVHGDMWAVWLPPKATVPCTFDDDEPFVLDARELRGVMSYGMLAAGDELEINSDHEGIIEITDSDLQEGRELVAGASFAELFDLNDTIIDVENKMFTHRPDCFGQLGVAREIAGIFGESFTSPEWYTIMPKFLEAEGLELEVFNDAGDKAPRFMAVAMENIDIKPSPLWLQTTLVRWGSKAINNVVDATNYVMLLSAQPTHAYDYDKLRGHKLGVRMAKNGEKLTLLNGKTYELTVEDIVIADGEGPVGLAGIMGGSDSEVDKNTKNIVLEVATFDMYALRKSSMRHGVFTDALTRFNKGQSPLQNPYVLSLLMQMINTERIGCVYDEKNFTDRFDEDAVGDRWLPTMIQVDFINERLGLGLKESQIISILKNVEFDVHEEENTHSVCYTAPFWRTDIEVPEDIVEEVGRLYGFDKLPRELPERSIMPVHKNTKREAKQKIRESLARAGANEVVTYSFVHENTLNRAEQDVEQAFKLSNALSPDLQYYRLSVLPSLLDKVHMNIKAGHDEFTLFEIGKGHNKKYHADDDQGLPSELEFVDMVHASKKPKSGAPYFYMRQLLSQLALDYGFTVKYEPIKETMDYPVTAPFDQSRSAMVSTWDGVFIGMVGELKQSVLKNFKLPQYTSAATLDLEGLQMAIEKKRQTYSPLSKYPGTTRDVSMKVANDVSYGAVMEAIMRNTDLPNLAIRTLPVGIYQGDDKTTKNITVRFEIVAHDHTITNEEATHFIESIEQVAKEKFAAEIV